MTKIMMPIVIRQSLSPSAIAIACAHASLGGFLKWKNDNIVQNWVDPIINKAFFKRIYQCKFKQNNLNEYDVFENIKKWRYEHIVMKESKLDNMETCIVFKPLIWSNSLYFDELELY